MVFGFLFRTNQCVHQELGELQTYIQMVKETFVTHGSIAIVRFTHGLDAW